MNQAQPAPAIWYVTIGDREQGPFTAAQMRTLVQQGKIGVATPVRKAGMAKPVAAGAVDGLLSAAPPPAPATPPPASPGTGSATARRRAA
ncbi:MAG: DUF4339 domain-containing protein, partial [Planctomycetota bacterium]